MDRNVRLASGLVALGLGLFGGRLGRTARIVALSVGAAELTTALTRYCPVSDLLGVNTCAMDPAEAAEHAWQETKALAE